jgi:uncharacterized repeat protein (TIGR01451 family)
MNKANRGLTFGICLPLAVLLVFLSIAVVSEPVYAGETDPISGIDCGCSKTGDYSSPHRGTAPAVELISVNEGISPNEIYRIVTSSSGIVISENKTGGAQVLNIPGIPDEAGWGFSPDDHRFVYHYFSAGQYVVNLYDLRQRPGSLVRQVSRTHIAGETTRIRFSPKGVYLFYLSVTASRQNTVSVVDTTGVVAHESTFSHSQGAGLEGDQFHNSTWNFSRDDHDRTMVYGWTTGTNSVRIRTVNLAARQVVSDIPISTIYSSFWRFSRCGDIMGLYIQEAGTVSPVTPNPVRLRLIGTLDGQDVFNDTFSTIDYTVFSCNETHHRATIGTAVYNLAPNSAPLGCEVTPEPKAELTNLSISDSGVTGGESTTGTVTLTLPAPANGFTVSLTSNRSEATVPSQVTVAAGATSATFEIMTVPVGNTVTATIKASAQGIDISRNLTIGSPRLISMELDSDTLFSGNSTVLRLELDGSVPSGGVEINLNHNAGDEVDLPDIARIWSGRNGSVWFETRGVAEPMAIEIQGTLMQNRSVTLHLMPAELQDVDYNFELFSPCVLRWSDYQVIGGRGINYRVVLNGEAPPAGAVIQLTSSDPSLITTPVSVTVEGRERSAVFQVMSAPVSSNTSVPLQASYRQRSIERSLTLVRPPVQYTIQKLKPPGSNRVNPVGMNESGQVLLINQDDQYYLWENGVYTPLHFPSPDGLRPVIVDFNDRGQYAGYLREIIHDRGYAIWEDGVRRNLHLPYGVSSASVVAINNQGQVAGSYVIPDNIRSHRVVVRWTHGQPTELTAKDDILASNYILIPKDINDRGKITTSGWRYTQNYHLPYYISTLHGRNYLRWARAEGYWMGDTHLNNHNTFTGGTTQIFRPDQTWLTAITPPLQSEYQQYSTGINDLDEIVGNAIIDFEANGFSIRQAIRVTEEGTWPLECMLADMDAGFELHYGHAINNAGQILTNSYFEDEDGYFEEITWLLTPVDAPRVNLQLSKSADASTVLTGALITYTMTVSNQGPDEARNVRLSAIIPDNQLLVSVDPDQGTCEEAEGTVLCDTGTLASGASAGYTVVTRAMVSGQAENRVGGYQQHAGK